MFWSGDRSRLWNLTDSYYCWIVGTLRYSALLFRFIWTESFKRLSNCQIQISLSNRNLAFYRRNQSLPVKNIADPMLLSDAILTSKSVTARSIRHWHSKLSPPDSNIAVRSNISLIQIYISPPDSISSRYVTTVRCEYHCQIRISLLVITAGYTHHRQIQI